MPDLSELPLKIAQTVQLQSAKYGQVRLYTKLIGYVDSQAVMITAPSLRNDFASILEGDQFVCRAFGGKHAFAFHTRVLRVVGAPLPHILLAYPSHVETVVVRKATRVAVQRSGSLVRSTADGQAPEPGTIADISLSGAGVVAKAGLVAVTETLELLIDANVALNQPELRLAAVVRSVRGSEGREAGGTCHYGLEFSGTTPEQQSALLDIIQKQLLTEI